MKYNDTQKIYLNYLLNKLNFENISNNFNFNFINHLQSSVHRYKKLGDCSRKEIIYNGEKLYIPENGSTTVLYKDNGTYFEVLQLSIFHYLQLEIDIKHKRLYSRIDHLSNKISATDISNFTFCPANYAISKSLLYRNIQETEKGNELHEKSLLKKLLNKSDNSISSEGGLDNLNHSDSYLKLKKLIDNCEVLYSGHSVKSQLFESSNGQFIGKPDFVIRDKMNGEIFVIEEKYQFSNNDVNKNRFYESHINQVLSYIYGIKEHQISFGVLVNWKYASDDYGNIFLHECYFRKVERSIRSRDKLNRIYTQIRNFNKNGTIKFEESNRKPNKCANCVNNFLCGHKTGKFNNLTLPYKEEFLKINNVIKPKEINRLDQLPYIESIVINLQETQSILKQREFETLRKPLPKRVRSAGADDV